MDTRSPRSSMIAGLLAGLAIGPSSVSAQFNHLACQTIRDPTPRATYTIQLNEVLTCILKAPAKKECHRVFKNSVNPQPPGGGPSGDLNVGKFLCYPIKCSPPDAGGGTDTVKDQFGSRTVQDGVVKLLCAPASPSGAFLDDPADRP